MGASSRYTFVDITMADVSELLARAKAVLTREDFERLNDIIGTLIELTRSVREKGATITRLRRMLGLMSSERAADVLGKEGAAQDNQQEGRGAADTDVHDASPPDVPHSSADSAAEGADITGDSDTTQQQSSQEETPQRKRKGHGRIPASGYKAANQIEVRHESLHVGCSCPSCTRGRLYGVAPARIIRIFGQPPLAARSWNIERLRCSVCGEVFVAQLPAEARGDKYAATAVSMMALLRYDAGLPLNRLQRLQSELETPLPATTQWQVVSSKVKAIIPVYDELSRLAADGSLVHNDDTYARVLELMGNRRDKLLSDGKLTNPDRTGLFTTAIVSHSAHGPIACFFTGRNHAGENLAQLLESRATGLPPPIQMCDALDRNLPKGHETIEANCLCHGRRHVIDEVEAFPHECRHILEGLGKVFHNEALCKKQGLTDEERLRFHQTHSAAVIDLLEVWMKAQLDDKRVEPNSGLGNALNYLLKRWDKLTLFLRVPGAPLENNTVERALKMAIAHRKNSLFYRSLHGAHVGDIYMTVIYTARLHRVNPFEYMTALLIHAEAVAKSPADWLPWTYSATLEQLRLANAA